MRYTSKHLSSVQALVSVLAIVVLLVLISNQTMAQVAEIRTYGGDDYDEAVMCAETSDGYVLVGTTSSAQNGNSDILVQFILHDLLPYDKILIGGSAAEQAKAVLVNNDGTVLILGQIAGGPHGGYDAVLYKITSDGNLLWDKYYGSSAWDLPSSLIRGGNYLYLGMTTYDSGNGTSNQRIYRLDDQGNELGYWDYDTLYNSDLVGLGFNYGYLFSLGNLVLPDGTRIGTGKKIDANMNIVWTRYEQDDLIEAKTIETSPFGVTFGFDYGDPNDGYRYDNRLVQYKSNGQLWWKKNYDLDGNQHLTATRWAGAELLYTSTTDIDGFGAEGGLAVKVFYNGGYLSSTIFGLTGDDAFHHILYDSDNHYVFTGKSSSYSSGDDDFFLVRTSNNTLVSVFEYDEENFADGYYTGMIEEQKPSILVYPNPANDRVFLDQPRPWMLFNASGQRLAQGVSNEIDVSNLPVGVYLIKDPDNAWQQRLVVER
ncbi:MAG: hypothetical protein RL226_632 [Bacteroidota bacterium]